jgi:hypothetical protein
MVNQQIKEVVLQAGLDVCYSQYAINKRAK